MSENFNGTMNHVVASREDLGNLVPIPNQSYLFLLKVTLNGSKAILRLGWPVLTQ